jgi:hypothetical protein
MQIFLFILSFKLFIVLYMAVNLKTFFWPILVIIISGCNSKPCCQTKKINGVSLVNPRNEAAVSNIAEVKRINADWVAIVPYAFSRQDEHQIHFNNEHQWWGEKIEGAAHMIDVAHAANLSVMLKPHIWMRGGWIGDFNLSSEEGWLLWEKEYENYILAYAKIASEKNVALLCIGTELKSTERARESFWIQLIIKIRSIYEGKLTYAANWDSYQDIGFWSKLDYIGIDAYFPLLAAPNPPSNELIAAWKTPKMDIQKLSNKLKKPILFTEYGYQSVDGAAGEHWNINLHGATSNMEIQSNAYEALYRSFWQESWFAGGFLWKWHLEGHYGGEEDPDFTPQGKHVEQVISKWHVQSR